MILSAIPASGKSTWAAKYQATHPNTYIVSSDQIRMEVTHGDFQDHSKQKEVWELFERRIHENGEIDGVTVILDALNDVNPVRLKYLSTTQEFDRKVLVMFNLDRERSRRLNNLRPENARVPADILEGLMNKFEEPDEEVLKYVDEIRYVYW